MVNASNFAELHPGPHGETTRPMPAFSAGSEVDPHRLRWYVHVAHAPDVRQTDMVLPLDHKLTIGRQVMDAPRMLELHDPMVSRTHVTLAPAPHDAGVLVTDLQSSNGVFVDGKRVHEATVKDGAVVRVGHTVLLVQQGPRGRNPEALGMVGRSPALHELRELVLRVGPSRLPVMVLGPTGSGKELVAQALHKESGRSGQFVAINCAALPATLVESLLFGHRKGAFTSAGTDHEGAFQRAHKGTLFLDEIGDMPQEVQPKVLRALESAEILPLGASRPIQVDVRVVVATHVQLQHAVTAGHFREDLLARLQGIVLDTPPLHRRRDDILLLLRWFLPPSHRHVPLAPDAAEALLIHGWPRNVRELQKLAERLPVLHPDASAWDLSMLDEEMQAPLRDRGSPQQPRLELNGPPDRDALVELLQTHGGNVSALAAAVGRNRKQVYRWMDQHGLPRGGGRA